MSSNLSKFKSKVHLLYSANISLSTITTVLNKDYKSIKNALNWIRTKHSNPLFISRVIEGRITKLNLREKRVINRDLLLSPKRINKRILFENSLETSTRGLQRFLKERGYSINVATKKPYIDVKNAKIQVKYAKETLKSYINKEINLKKVIFSDESCMERGHRARPKYARKKGNKLSGREMISST